MTYPKIRYMYETILNSKILTSESMYVMQLNTRVLIELNTY